MAESNDLQAALDEYGSSASPYSALDRYLMQQPVYDRGPREAPAAPTLRTLEAITPDTEDMLASQYERIMEEQRAAEEAATAARQAEIDSLRDLSRQELSTSEDAAWAQRSDITKALEGRIADMQKEVDAETLDLRQAGLDERAALARQIEEGDRLVRQAQEAAIGDLSDRQSSLVGDLTQRIGSLSTDLTDINSVIESNFQELLDRQQSSASELSAIQAATQTATDQELTTLGQHAESTQSEIGSISQQLESLGGTQDEINVLNQQLETLYTDVESGNAAQSETIRNETANLIAGLEQQIGGLADNLGALPIDAIQSQLASVNDQTAQFQQAVDSATGQRAELASRIDALQAAGLTQDDLAAAINPISQQRQEAISAAVNPIQAQIEALRGEIPQQVDTEALRQQITDDIMAQMQSQQPPSATTTPPITVGSAEGQQGIVVEPEMDAYGFGPSASEAAGFNPYGGGLAAAMNVSDGRADQMGYFDDYQGRGGTRPATEDIARMGANPYGELANAAASTVTPKGDQSLLNQFSSSQAAKDFGLTATFDPATGQYVTDLGGFGFRGDQRYKRQTPEEFADQFKTRVKPNPQVAIAPPPKVQATGGVAGIPKQNLFDPMSLRFPNMRMR